MLGTLNGALEVRGIVLDGEAIRADVRGINAVRDGIPVLTAIEVAYALTIPPGSREVVDRALAKHQAKCPTAQTLQPAVAISWTAAIAEETDQSAST